MFITIISFIRTSSRGGRWCYCERCGWCFHNCNFNPCVSSFEEIQERKNWSTHSRSECFLLFHITNIYDSLSHCLKWRTFLNLSSFFARDVCGGRHSRLVLRWIGNISSYPPHTSSSSVGRLCFPLCLSFTLFTHSLFSYYPILFLHYCLHLSLSFLPYPSTFYFYFYFHFPFPFPFYESAVAVSLHSTHKFYPCSSS